MRAWDITRYTVLVAAAIGLVQGGAGGMGLFTQHYFPNAPQNEYVHYSVGQLNSTLQDQQGMSVMDYLNAIGWLILSGLWVIINMLAAVVVLFPYLIWVFHMPWWFAGFIQVVIYMDYQAGIAQWKAGRQMGWIQ